MHLTVDDLVKSICSYFSRYQESLRNLDNRARLIQLMVTNLRKRSFATTVYASPCSWAPSPFIKRNLKDGNQMMEKFSDVNGNTQV
jgi:hypothetical protein